MIDVEIDEAIRSNPEFLPAVKRATAVLTEVIGPVEEPVSAEWQLFGADGRLPTVRLKVSREGSSRMTQFNGAAFSRMTESALGLVLARLWGDLLQDLSRAQILKLKQMIEQM